MKARQESKKKRSHQNFDKTFGAKMELEQSKSPCLIHKIFPPHAESFNVNAEGESFKSSVCKVLLVCELPE